MVKTVLTVLTIAYLLNVINEYETEIIPRLLSANQTLLLNYEAERQLYHDCKKNMVPM